MALWFVNESYFDKGNIFCRMRDAAHQRPHTNIFDMYCVRLAQYYSRPRLCDLLQIDDKFVAFLFQIRNIFCFFWSSFHGVRTR